MQRAAVSAQCWSVSPSFPIPSHVPPRGILDPSQVLMTLAIHTRPCAHTQKTAGVDVERARAVLEANGPLDLENTQLRTADLKLLETFEASERSRRLQRAGTITVALVGTGLGCLAYLGQSWRFG